MWNKQLEMVHNTIIKQLSKRKKRRRNGLNAPPLDIAFQIIHLRARIIGPWIFDSTWLHSTRLWAHAFLFFEWYLKPISMEWVHEFNQLQLQTYLYTYVCTQLIQNTWLINIALFNLYTYLIKFKVSLFLVQERSRGY